MWNLLTHDSRETGIMLQRKQDAASVIIQDYIVALILRGHHFFFLSHAVPLDLFLYSHFHIRYNLFSICGRINKTFTLSEFLPLEHLRGQYLERF